MEMERTAFTRWYKEAVKEGLTYIKKRKADKKIGSKVTFYKEL